VPAAGARESHGDRGDREKESAHFEPYRGETFLSCSLLRRRPTRSFATRPERSERNQAACSRRTTTGKSRWSW
jgi:hypothetical protein